MREMQQVMSDNVSIFRNHEKLSIAVEQLKTLRKRAKRIAVSSNINSANPELVAAYRVNMMLKLSLCVAQGALNRTESRGAHYREDHPLRNDKDWLRRTLVQWPQDSDELPTFSYEALDVDKMEMPPGWRGYGGKERVEHPDTESRQNYVDKTRSASTSNEALQLDLNPYKHLLPECFRGDNERLNFEPQGQKND
jgi:fumarate reductase flavoprotein subunit